VKWISLVAFCMGVFVATLGFGSIPSLRARVASAQFDARFSRSSSATLGPFAGAWKRHGGSIRINRNGTGHSVFRAYTNCTNDRPAVCDKILGNRIYSGDVMEFRLNQRQGNRARGTITYSARSWQTYTGITLTLLRDGTLRVTTVGRSFDVCRENNYKPKCGA